MEDFGYVLKRNDNDYVIQIDPNTYEGGYNVVPKTVDPYNAYDIEVIAQYWNDNPQMRINLEDVQAREQKMIELVERQAQLNSVNYQLFNRMVQKVFNPDTQTMDEYIPTTEELLAQKAQLEASIASIKESLSVKMNGN